MMACNWIFLPPTWSLVTTAYASFSSAALGTGAGVTATVGYACASVSYNVAFTGTAIASSVGDNYLNNSNCTWTIQAGAGNRVQLSFSAFQTEAFVDTVSIF